MTQTLHRIGLTLTVTVMGSALLVLLVGSSGRVALGVPLVLGAGVSVAALLLLGRRGVVVHHTGRR